MKPEQLLKELYKNPFLLAPMAGVTDHPFRSFMKEMSCGILTTELISAKSLQLGNPISRKLMTFSEDQRPIGVQIFGEDLAGLREASQIVEQAGADFIDLNFGCPVPKVVKKGAGSAMLKDLKTLRQVLNTVKKATTLPVSIKVRTGWTQDTRNTPEVAKIAGDEGIIWIAVHGRTRAQAYSGTADWPYIAEVKSLSPIPVIGNGDLKVVDQIHQLKKDSGCDGMMIGRGALKNPWIFKDIQIAGGLVGDATNKPATNSGVQKQGELRSYIQVLDRLKHHLQNFYEERMFLLQYKKFSTWYSAGFPDSANFRGQVFQSKSQKEVLERVKSYFSRIDSQTKQTAGYPSSLMWGHG